MLSVVHEKTAILWARIHSRISDIRDLKYIALIALIHENPNVI